RLLDLLHDRAGVLGVHVDLAARESGVGDLGAADAVLEVDRVPLCLERLLVELAEDVLLGEVLRPERDRRLALARAARGGAARRARLLAAAAGRQHEAGYEQQRQRVQRSLRHPIPFLACVTSAAPARGPALPPSA